MAGHLPRGSAEGTARACAQTSSSGAHLNLQRGTTTKASHLQALDDIGKTIKSTDINGAVAFYEQFVAFMCSLSLTAAEPPSVSLPFPSLQD